MPAEPTRVTCHVLDTGYCLARENHVMRGGRRRTIECHALVGLIRHPREGWLLWDTGYSSRLLDETRTWPYRLYRWATPLRLRPEWEVASQLARYGLQPRDVRHVIISHFHADHIAGLREFPEATIVASESAFQSIDGLRGFAALRRALVPALLPSDLKQRCRPISEFGSESLGPFGSTHDLFNDGSLRLVPLPGHARGQMGLLAETERGPWLFAADACYLREAARTGRPPHWITHLIVDNPQEVRLTLDKLQHFWRERPEVEIIPTHCPEALRMFAEGPP